MSGPSWLGLLGRPGMRAWLLRRVPALGALTDYTWGALGRDLTAGLTVATVAVADVVPGGEETSAHGLFAVFQPDSGPIPLGSRDGALLDLYPEGLEGQTRRRIQTDTDAWHIEDLSLPAGVRTGPFRATLRTGPVSAIARFGPTGVEGTLTAGTFRDPADALIVTPAREPIAVRLGPVHVERDDVEVLVVVADKLPHRIVVPVGDEVTHRLF